MSEGTMQRRVQRDQHDRQVKRLSRVLVGAAAVPVMLVAAGCSSDSGSDEGKSASEQSASASASATASPSPTVREAAYGKLPEPCDVLTKKTLKDLVPKAKSGKEGSSSDTATRAGCSWDSLDDNGVKGSQFRWLNVSLLRFESDVTRGAGDDLAHEYYEKQIKDAQNTDGAKSVRGDLFAGAGDEASIVQYVLKKKEGTFKQQTAVARVENVVVTVDYNGAGLAGDESPDAKGMVTDAKRAAKEAVAAVSAANGASASASASASNTTGTSGGSSDDDSDDDSSSSSKSKSSSKSSSKKS
ncbi:DUF3558 family protein [Streptomyces sp. enrichment culture]|uniref:DUF3558 family protein n=1 Tax=Streptomyces sp. enrichment culture TaxID=1795815 RepID=UPI003F5616F8